MHHSRPRWCLVAPQVANDHYVKSKFDIVQYPTIRVQPRGTDRMSPPSVISFPLSLPPFGRAGTEKHTTVTPINTTCAMVCTAVEVTLLASSPSLFRACVSSLFSLVNHCLPLPRCPHVRAHTRTCALPVLRPANFSASFASPCLASRRTLGACRSFEGKRNQNTLREWVLANIHPDSRPFDLTVRPTRSCPPSSSTSSPILALLKTTPPITFLQRPCRVFSASLVPTNFLLLPSLVMHWPRWLVRTTTVGSNAQDQELALALLQKCRRIPGFVMPYARCLSDQT